MAPTAAERPALPFFLLQYLFPPLLVVVLFFHGIIPTLKYMIFHPFDIFSFHRWHMCILNGGQPFLLAAGDRQYGAEKKKVVAQAYGRVLEVGAGTGETVKYYDKSKVDAVYGVEPNTQALPELRKHLVKYGMVEKYEILNFGVEDAEKMVDAGVRPGSIDTVVCV